MSRTAEDLIKILPGVGRYTAGAIASIAYQEVSYFYQQHSREIIRLVASIHPFVCVFDCLCVLFCLNYLSFDLDFRYGGWPWPWLDRNCRSRQEEMISLFLVKVVGQRPRSNRRTMVHGMDHTIFCLYIPMKNTGITAGIFRKRLQNSMEKISKDWCLPYSIQCGKLSCAHYHACLSSRCPPDTPKISWTYIIYTLLQS